MDKIFLRFFLILFFTTELGGKIIYDFSKDTDLQDWKVVDDVVMGGQSSGLLMLDEYGNGLFTGYVSLENFGGFSSIRLKHKLIKIRESNYIILRVFGDDKFYQIRVRSKKYDRHVYVKRFYANSEWNLIRIPLKDMQPQFRGRSLRMNNFNSDSIAEIGFLIGNKVEENFSLIIDYIGLE